MTASQTDGPWSRVDFEEMLRAKGSAYHIHHPFHVAMYDGTCTVGQIRGWVANRYYYQINIPIKDAAVIANCNDSNVRGQWVQRILDHDGYNGESGGIEAWLQLAEAVGLSRQEVISEQHVLPAVRFAVDAYVNFARRASWQQAACSSLTEMFAPQIHRSRLQSWPQHYPWINSQGLDYFRKRLGQARRDVDHGLAITLDYFTSKEQQCLALNTLQFKLDILWTMLDAMTLAYQLGRPPYYNLDVAPAYHTRVLV